MPYLYQELKTLSPLFAPIEACFYSSDQSDYLVYLLISVYVIYTSFGGCFGKWVIFNIILHVIVALCAATVVEDNYNISLSLSCQCMLLLSCSLARYESALPVPRSGQNK